MKKLFAVILSLTLIIAPIPSVNTAHASSGGSSMTQQIVGIANGIVGAGLITKCKMASMQPSVMVYMAGSITYLLGEITTAKKKTKDMGNMADSVNAMKANMTEGGDYQKKIIQTQLDNEKSNLEFIRKRKMFVIATMAIYAVATALAYFEAWRELPPPPAGPGLGITSFAGCDGNPASDLMWVQAVGGAYAAISSSGGNITAGGVAIGAVSGIAVAKLMPMLLGAVGLANPIAVTGQQMAWARIAFFAVMTALVAKIMSELSAEEKKVNERIASLQKILNQMPGEMNAIAEGTSTDPNAVKPDGTDEIDPVTKKPLKALPKGTALPKVCYGADKTVSEGACAAKKFQLNRPKLDSQLGMNTLQSSSNVANDYAQAMIDGDYEKAEMMSGSLQNAAANAKKISDGLSKKLNEHLVATGKKPFDLDAESKKQYQAMAASFAKNGMDFTGAGSSSLGDIGSSAVSETKPTDGTSGAEGAVVNTASGADASGAVAAGDLSAIDAAANAEQGLLDPNADANKTASLDDSLNQFESNENDISKDTGVSIFKQVSNRYLLNYTKIFNRKKIDPPMAPAEPMAPVEETK